MSKALAAELCSDCRQIRFVSPTVLRNYLQAIRSDFCVQPLAWVAVVTTWVSYLHWWHGPPTWEHEKWKSIISNNHAVQSKSRFAAVFIPVFSPQTQQLWCTSVTLGLMWAGLHHFHLSSIHIHRHLMWLQSRQMSWWRVDRTLPPTAWPLTLCWTWSVSSSGIGLMSACWYGYFFAVSRSSSRQMIACFLILSSLLQLGPFVDSKHDQIEVRSPVESARVLNIARSSVFVFFLHFPEFLLFAL